MTYTEIKNKIAAYVEVGFTQKEAFANLRDSLRERSRKSSKIADAQARAAEANGTYQYGNFGKEYATRKF